jgi:hypothetical protein
MLRSRHTASSSTYSLQVAQLPASEFPAGPRLLRGADRPPHAPASLEPSSSGATDRLIDSFDRAVPLPSTPRAFLAYLAVLALIAAGMLLQISLSAQILQARVEVERLQEVHDNIQSRNAELVWEIARRTNLEHIQQAAYAQGYRPITRRQYVFMPAAPQTLPVSVQEASLPATLPASQFAQAKPVRAAATPMPEGRDLSQWWQPWQERIEMTATLLLERIFGA